MWSGGDVWASARRDKMASRWACPRARTSWSRERTQPAAPTRKWRTTSSHDFDLRRAEGPQAHVDDSFSSRKDKFFLWWSLCQSTGRKLDLLGQWDFEEALGRCDVRTNTVVPVLCLLLGTPRCCCTSWILSKSCNGLVHALILQSLVPPLSPSLSG